jgi:hypothetical protein
MLPESHGPTILARRARAMRLRGDCHAFAQEELEPSTPWDIIRIHLLRPTSELSHGTIACLSLTHTDMLIFEPLTQGAAIWIGLAYGIV